MSRNVRKGRLPRMGWPAVPRLTILVIVMVFAAVLISDGYDWLTAIAVVAAVGAVTVDLAARLLRQPATRTT